MSRQRSFTRLDAPELLTSDATIRERSGRGWEQWFDTLDDWGAADRTHRDTSRWVAEQLGVASTAWAVQTIVASYERVRGVREPGERDDGFAVSASKTVAVPVEELFRAFADETRRARWLPDAPLRERTATSPRSARFDWGDGATRVNAGFTAKGDAKSTVSVEHARLGDAQEAARMKAFWRERLSALKAALES